MYLLIFLHFLWLLSLHNETNCVDSPNFLAQEAHSMALLSNVSFLKSCFLNNRGQSKLVCPSDTTLVCPSDSKLVCPSDSKLVCPSDTTLVCPSDTTLVCPSDTKLQVIDFSYSYNKTN